MLDFFHKRKGDIKTDVLSGITVALALVPEAVAFAFVAGVSPIIGLYSAFFMGLVTAAIGGRPGMISGATGAVAVVIVSLVAIHGIEYLFPTVILCGLIQVAVGVGRLGKLIRMVPYPVMLGFVNGLAIVIFMAQFGSFHTISRDGSLVYLGGAPLAVMLGLVGLTMAIIWLLPKLSNAVPAALAGILIVSLLSAGINAWAPQNLAGSRQDHVVLTVGDMLMTNARAQAAAKAKAQAAPPQPPMSETEHQVAGPTVKEHPSDASEALDALDEEDATPPVNASPEPRVAAAMASVDRADVSLGAGLPSLFFFQHLLPPITLATLWIIAPYALIMAGVGLIESLMTLSLIDEITETRGHGNRECIGQGIANVVSGFFGGMGGCAMIGQSLINVNAGGRGRLSGIVAAVCLLMFILFLSPWIEMIPMAALVGVMFMVVIGTFEWASLKMFRRMPWTDMAVMVFVTVYTVFMHDLASAVVLGVVVSAVMFAWEHATHVAVDVKHNEFGSKIYQLHGPLFFASVASFKEMFDPANDPDDVVIDFYYTRVYDQSGLEAINVLAEKYGQQGKRLHLTHLSPECRQLLDRAGDLIEVNLSEDPQYHVATDRLG